MPHYDYISHVGFYYAHINRLSKVIEAFSAEKKRNLLLRRYCPLTTPPIGIAQAEAF